MTSRLFSGQPTIGSQAHIEAMAAAVIGGVSTEGGRGDIIGVIQGVLVVGLISNGLNILNVPAYNQLIIMGSILILSVVIDRMRLIFLKMVNEN